MIPDVPSTLAIFAALTSKSNNVKLQRAITIAMEVSAILAPFIDRPVSWRSINESLYTTLDVLIAENIVSQELGMAMAQSVTEMNNINNTITSIQQLNSNDPNYLNNLNRLTDILNSQSRTLSANIDTYDNLSSGNIPTITNITPAVQNNLSEFGQSVDLGLSNISSNIASLSSTIQAVNALGVTNTGAIQDINTVLQDINRVQNNIQNVINITNNIVGMVNNIQRIANNLLKIKTLFNNKRKARKTLPKLPAIIDPKNSQYYSLYSSINTTINSFNTTITTLGSIPRIPFLS
jgi:hypothetical protein